MLVKDKEEKTNHLNRDHNPAHKPSVTLDYYPIFFLHILDLYTFNSLQ